MRTIFFIFLSISSFAQTFTRGDTIYNFIENYKVPVARVKEGASRIITGTPGQAYFPRIIIAEGLGVLDTTKRVVLYLTMKVESVTPVPPPPPVLTSTQVDGENAVFSTGIAVNGVTVSKWFYHGATTATGWYMNTLDYSNVVGSTATFTFTGKKIELWAEKKSTHGTGQITVRQGTTIIEDKPVSFVSATTVLPAKVYESALLPQGTYTITLKCVSGNVLLDYFVVSQ